MVIALQQSSDVMMTPRSEALMAVMITITILTSVTTAARLRVSAA
jgi:hypothetical protein